jgi:pyruvate,water dikinase
MKTWLPHWLAAPWRARRKRREEAALGWLKARYHVFRVLLGHNDRALELLAEVDRGLRDNEAGRLAGVVADLGETVLELADALNRLTSNGHTGLYGRLDQIQAALDESLARLARAPRRLWLPLAEATADLRDQVGGKAQPLAMLLRAGLPVPEGLCFTRRACREYLRQAGLDERLRAVSRRAGAPGADHGVLAAEARAMFAAAPMPPAFAQALRAAWDFLAGPDGAVLAVRSSASSEDGEGQSYAGQYESVLGVRDAEAFAQAFVAVVASAFSARALAYRAQAGLSGQAVDMAVFVQRMVAARTAGVLYTMDPVAPDSRRMVLTAVPGLGSTAVSGSAPADVCRPSRELGAEDPADTPTLVADKTVREVLDPAGGVRREDVPEDLRRAPLLSPEEIAALRELALRVEALAGCPQDIEWAVDGQGRPFILQARPARLARTPREEGAAGGRELLAGGLGVSPGRAVGRVFAARSREDLARAARGAGPVVLALRQSLADAVALVPDVAALLVDLGNPLDHLACVARERGVPMIIGLGTATSALAPGQWVLADADRGAVLAADEKLWQGAPPPSPRPAPAGNDAAKAVRELTLPLTLTDAYGPTFSILECRTLHDFVRYIHEKAVMALFQTGDAITDDVFSLVRRLRDVPGLAFFIIDLGGAVAPGSGATIGLDAVLCEPLAALIRGMSAPGLGWGRGAPGGDVSGLLSRALLDGRGERPVGNPNYALATRDYLNLNARVDYHFAMIDAVCGANPRQNAVRFRFKGGGTARVQRERRAVFVEEVLRAKDFFTARQGDMVTGQFAEAGREAVADKLEMLGCLLGFSRLLDAAMIDDAMPARAARAFLSGDYALAGLAGGEADPETAR